MDQVTITIGGLSLAGLGAAAVKFVPLLLKKMGKASVPPPPREIYEVKAMASENRIRIDNLADTCKRMSEVQDKTFEIMGAMGKQVGDIAVNVGVLMERTKKR